MSLLLERGANVDTSNATGRTALQCAAQNGFEDAVKLPLEKGADGNAKDENEQRTRTPECCQDAPRRWSRCLRPRWEHGNILCGKKVLL